MAVIKVGNNNIGKISVIEPYDDTYGENVSVREPWVRPSEWLDMPVIGSGDDKIAILMYVPSGTPSEVSIYLRGTYINSATYPTHSTINWGDGSTAIASGSNVNDANNPDHLLSQSHLYDYQSLTPESEFVKDGQTCRQALIEIDNVSGCNYLDLSRFGLNDVYQEHDSFTYNNQTSKILDIHIASQNLQTLMFKGHVSHLDIERVRIDTPSSLLTGNNLFSNMNSLRTISIPSGLTSGATDLRYLFHNCYNLDSIPFFDSSSCTRLDSAFSSCHNISSFPEINTSNVTNFSYTFSTCRNLESIPILDYSNATSVHSLFSNCKRLRLIPENIYFTNAGTTDYMFNGCSSLQFIPEYFFDSFANSTSHRSFLAYCYDLKSIPKINFPNSTTMRAFATHCQSLEEVKIGDLSKVTDGDGFYACFSYCYNNRKVTIDSPENFNSPAYHQMFVGNRSLKELPYLNTSSGTNLVSMFEGCSLVKTAPIYDLSSATSTSSMFQSCTSIKKMGGFKNTNTGISTANNMFRSLDSLEEIPSGILDSSGISPQNISHMLYPNLKIKKIPVLNLSGTDNASSLCRNMAGLTEVGEITFNSGINSDSIFYGCTTLRQIGYSDASLVSNFTNAFYGCLSLERCELSGIPVSISFYNNLLGSGALEDIFYNLSSGVTGQTIDIRQNYGVSELHSDTIAIATNKGWTVTT